MEPGLIDGDQVLVLKPVYGARLFNIFSFLREEQTRILRIPGFSHVKHNDVIVFNFPHPHSWDKIEMHILKYYIKRCVALPGDIISIENGYYKVCSQKKLLENLGNEESQKRISLQPKESFEKGVYKAFPFDSIIGWNIQDFGPLYVPRAGDFVTLDRNNYIFYRKIIEWEQNSELEYRSPYVYLDGKRITSYCFLKSYYFTAGDNGENSQDSRYWGLLPEEYIVGKAWVIWKSSDPYTGDFRWRRFIRKIR